MWIARLVGSNCRRSAIETRTSLQRQTGLVRRGFPKLVYRGCGSRTICRIQFLADDVVSARKHTTIDQPQVGSKRKFERKGRGRDCRGASNLWKMIGEVRGSSAQRLSPPHRMNTYVYISRSLRKGWADGRVPILSTSDLSVNGLLDQPAGLEINKSSAEQGLEEGLAHQYYTAPIPGWTSYWLRVREILSVRRKHRAYLLYLCLHLKIKN
jgi:hypothetical protein